MTPSAPQEDGADRATNTKIVGWRCDDVTEFDLADLATREATPEVQAMAERCICDIDATDAAGRALGRAAQFGRADTVAYLLDIGADVVFTGGGEPARARLGGEAVAVRRGAGR